MNQAILHYIYDPLCGWCYGAAPLLAAARQLPGIAIELHAGGLWMGTNRPAMGKALRDYVRPHDQRIQALTAQPFGDRYFHELLLTPDRQLDSEPPIRAILAVVASGGDGLQMLTRIQQSHYRDGNWIGDLHPLGLLAAEQGIERQNFEQGYRAVALANHLATSQQWLQRLGARGYPTLGLELSGRLIPLAISDFFGDPDGFCQYLLNQWQALSHAE